MSAHTKPEAIRLAEMLDKGGYFTHIEMNQCGNELRRQHSQIHGYRCMVDRFHHVMKKHGLHPGRTDDDLIQILDETLSKAKYEANASLIEAAPDMLKALRRAVLALAFAAENSPAMRDDYNAVSEAIAKATGSAS
jgi:hypothetical protein